MTAAHRRRTAPRIAGVAAFLSIVAAGVGCTLDVISPLAPPPERWDPALDTHPDSGAFRRLLERYVREGLPGVVLLVRTPEGRWNGAAGYARIEAAEPMTPMYRFHAASVTKTYLAAATLLLAEDGTVDLDERIARYLPEAMTRKIPNGSRATVRQLLAHRSGIPDFAGALAYELDFLNDPFGSYPPDRLLSYLEGQSALSAPGTSYFYANANYYILALALDRAVPGGHAAAVTERILRPLGLHATYYRNEPGYPATAGLVDGYQDLAGDGRLMNVTDLMMHNDRVFMGNAGLIATSADFADFLEALLGGGLLSPTSLAAMEAWSEPSRYGLGLSRLDTPFGPAIGHSGGDIGALAQVRYFPTQDATLVLLSNGGDSGITEALFARLWEEAQQAALGGAGPAPRDGGR